MNMSKRNIAGRYKGMGRGGRVATEEDVRVAAERFIDDYFDDDDIDGRGCVRAKPSVLADMVMEFIFNHGVAVTEFMENHWDYSCARTWVCGVCEKRFTADVDHYLIDGEWYCESCRPGGQPML